MPYKVVTIAEAHQTQRLKRKNRKEGSRKAKRSISRPKATPRSRERSKRCSVSGPKAA